MNILHYNFERCWLERCNKQVMLAINIILINLPITVFGDSLVATDGIKSSEPIRPLPLSIEVHSGKVALGKKLFNDARLSQDKKTSCASCHQLDQGGDDGLPRSVTNSGAPDVINAPTVFNSGLNFRQTWRGQFRTLEAQAEADLHNPRHANTTWPKVIEVLESDRSYVKQFAAIYENGITRETVLDAIATFERSLITPNASFDRFLRGDRNAITEEQKKGYTLFKQFGCVSCHQGRNVGGNLFSKFGHFDNYFERRGNIEKADFGRFNVTGEEQDRFVFRVPSLRNVAVTGPYFHDGSVANLVDAVKIMARSQLGRDISDGQAELIVMFLESLTGEYQGKVVGGPELNKK